MTHRIVIFAGPTVGWVPSLLNAFLKELDGRTDIGSVKVCVTSEDVSRLTLAPRTLLSYAGKALFNPRIAGNFDAPRFSTVATVAEKFGVEIIKPPRYKINDPEFIQLLKESHAPTLALSLGCLQIWSADLLRVFGLAVNFHNGYLPNYKGLWATHWSVYRSEEFSGYAFHVMDEKIDTGPVIFRGRVPIPPNVGPAAIERLKLESARKDVGKVLDAMASGHFETLVLPKGGSYFSGKASTQIWTIDDPKKLTAAELYRRVFCFAPLKIQFDGTYYPVSSLKPVRGWGQPLSFVTADGVELYADRLQYVPARLYLAARRIKALMAPDSRPLEAD